MGKEIRWGLAATLISASLANGAVVDATWIGGAGPAGWWEASNWDVGVVPANTATTQYNILIDGGDTATDATVHVSGGISGGINNLTIDSGDTLWLDGHTDGFVIDGTGAGGSVTNNGLFSMTDDQAGMDPFITLKGPVAFSGAGEFQLTGDGYVKTAAGIGGSLTNASGHTIRGGGILGGDGADGSDANFLLHNNGLISADDYATFGEMTIFFADGSTNTGTLQNSDGGILVLNPIGGPGVYLDNTGGEIKSNSSPLSAQIAGVSGGALSANGDDMYIADIKGATLQSSDSRHFIAQTSYGWLEDITLNGDLRFELYEGEGPVIKGDWTNNGDMQIVDVSGSPHKTPYFIRVDGTTTISGAGSFGFSNSNVYGQLIIGSLEDETPDELIIGSDQVLFSEGAFNFREMIVGDGNLIINNQGLIEARDSSNIEIYFAPGSVNSGTIRSLDGAGITIFPTQGNDSFFDNTNGVIEFVYFTIDSILSGISGGEIIFNYPSSVVFANLKGVTLKSNSAEIECYGSQTGALEDITLIGNFSFYLEPGSPVTLTGEWLNNGTLKVEPYDDPYIVPQGIIEIGGVLTLSGSGSIDMVPQDYTGPELKAKNTEPGDKIINMAGHTIRGAGTLGDGVLQLENYGSIIADSYETPLQIYIGPGTINNGIISCSGGSLYLRPVDNDADYFMDNTNGLIVGTIFMDSIISGISGGILRADGVTMDIGVIKDATLESPNGGYFTLYGLSGSLDNITNNGEVYAYVLGANAPKLKGLLTNEGVVNIGGDSEYYHDEANDLVIDGAVTLDGNGSLVLDNESSRLIGYATDGADTLINETGHTIKGAGTLGGGGLAMTNAGILSPGSSPGILTIDGGMDFTETAELVIELDGTTAGSGYDVLQFINGDLALDGELTVSLINGFDTSVLPTDSFTIVASQDSSALIGTFSNLLPGSRILTSDGAASFAVSISGGSVILSDYRTGPTPGADVVQDWVWDNFGDLAPETESTVWGDDANPDNDPFTNLEEYAFDLSPGSSTVTEQAVQLMETLDAGQFTIRIRQRKVSSDPNLSFAVQISETLAPGSWTTASTTEIPPRVSIDDNAEWVTYQLPAPVDDVQFLRVETQRTTP